MRKGRRGGVAVLSNSYLVFTQGGTNAHLVGAQPRAEEAKGAARCQQGDQAKLPNPQGTRSEKRV
ncbi:MAG: hypothetical protein ACPLQO_11395, partial [Desulfotomaculales bacterium]